MQGDGAGDDSSSQADVRRCRNCSSCAEAKVKCTGMNPCSRCSKKGLTCVFNPIKKRSARKRKEVETGEAGREQNVHVKSVTLVEDSCIPASTIDEPKRLLWSMFVTLYEHYRETASARYWFHVQLLKLCGVNRRNNENVALGRLMTWLSTEKLDEESLEWLTNHQKQSQGEFPADHIPWAGGSRIASNASSNSSASSNVEAWSQEPGLSPKMVTKLASQPQPPAPFFGETSSARVSARIDFSDLAARSIVKCSPAFVELYGMTSEFLENDLESNSGGFLPWGADLLSRVVLPLTDLLTFVQVLCLKFSTYYAVDGDVTMQRAFSSAHRFKTHVPSRPGFSYCTLTCLHRLFFASNARILDLYIDIEVDEPASPPVESFPLRESQETLDGSPVARRGRLDDGD